MMTEQMDLPFGKHGGPGNPRTEHGCLAVKLGKWSIIHCYVDSRRVANQTNDEHLPDNSRWELIELTVMN